MKKLVFLLVILMLKPFGTGAQDQNAKARFYEGVVAEEVTGELDKALSIYQELLKNSAGDRQLAAKCLYHIGLTYEKKGSDKALGYYADLLEKYPDQADLADLARGRIAKLKDANTFIDPRDGHKYKWVKIGNQIWMAENLAYMPHVNPPMKQENGIWVYEYGGFGGCNVAEAKASKNYQNYGCLYDWPTAMGLHHKYLEKSWGGDPTNHQGICPPGWHIPTDKEWKELEKSCGMPDSLVDELYSRAGRRLVRGVPVDLPAIGGYLKASSGWNSDGGGTNATGFGVLAGGERWENIISSKIFSGLGYSAGFWTSTEGDSIAQIESGFENAAWFRQFVGRNSQWTSNNDIDRDVYPKSNGYSVRCIKSINLADGLGDQNSTNVLQSILSGATKSENKATILTEEKSSTTFVKSWNQFFGNQQHSGYVMESIPRTIPRSIDTIPTGKNGWMHPIEGNACAYYLIDDTTIGKYENDEASVFWHFNLKISGLSLTYVNNMLLFQAGNTARETIFALDTDKKEIIWSYTGKKPFNFYMAANDVSLFVGCKDSCLYSINHRTGELNWKFKANSIFEACPVISGDLVFTTSFKQITEEYRNRLSYLYAIDVFSGKEVWKVPFEGSIFSSPSISGNTIVVGGGDFYLYAFDINTGKKKWRFYTDGKVWDCPSIANGKVFFQSHAGYFFCVDLNSGEEVWKFKFGNLGGGYFHSIVSDDVVMFGSLDSCLYALDTQNGRVLWKFPVESRVTFNPVLIDHKIFFRIPDKIVVLEY